jgi:type IV pilus assembly protein PilB
MLEDAVKARASDIHVEPMADRLRVRLRVDGVCKTVAEYPTSIQGAVTSRLKLLGEMDLAEKRKPQDGRIAIKAAGKDVDIRVSLLPGSHGEALVMRLLDKTTGLVSLERLGLGGEDLRRFRRMIKRPNGIFLVTGPTGSGKTTTLYAALSELNRPDVKIITGREPRRVLLRRASISVRSSTRSDSISSASCAPCCVRRRTSSSSAKSATVKRRVSPFRRR